MPMNSRHLSILPLCFYALLSTALAQEVRIEIDASKDIHRVSRLLTGSCIEDVNHEIYGGLYSQMIFGESFQEPELPIPIRGFKPYAGGWRVTDGVLSGSAGDGPKLVSDRASFEDGEIRVEIFFEDNAPGNSGLIVRMNKPGSGADNFDGYEVSLNPANQSLVIGRHRHDWNLIREVPCQIKLNEWIPLAVKLKGASLEASVNGERIFQFEDGERLIPSGTVALRQWQRTARYRNLEVKVGDKVERLPFEHEHTGEHRAVSSMWRAVHSGSAAGAWSLETERPFVGQQCQVLSFRQGAGEIGVENRGLNRWGMSFVADKPYEGVLWARADKPTKVWVSIESQDGSKVLAEKELTVDSADWQRLEFQLTPKTRDADGRFAIKLKKSGSVHLGYAFLQPGSWGRFKNLPVRRDVVEGLIAQGVTVMRYGGSMVSIPTYRWKNMIGPRDLRQPYKGYWYQWSTNGWGIVDFMEFCEAAGFEYVPTFHFGETPEDMADFIRYAKAPADSEWGKKRAADGHPAPFKLKYLQLGNEERVDLAYATKFEALAKAIWQLDPEIILVVGDFVYSRPIQDPFRFDGAASGITSLEGQKKILEVAKAANREVWFDVHVGTDGPRPDSSFDGLFSYKSALSKLADGAKYKVLTFEFNSNSHNQRRAIANALAIQAIERDGELPIATSANALQPDGQNDNGWDQGLLFLNPSQVWLQPTGYVTRMYSQDFLPRLVKCDVTGAAAGEAPIDCNARLSEDGRALVLSIVNPTDQTLDSVIHLAGFTPPGTPARVTEMTAALTAKNTAADPNRVQPRTREWTPAFKDGSVRYTVSPWSVTVIRWE